MIEEFKSYIDRILQIDTRSKIIVAVSGGIDSTVLLHLCSEVFEEVVIAHCNFQLRGNEAERDEEFVRAMAEQLKVPFYVEKFNTTKYAVDHKISIQVAARDLRYAWFENLRTELNFDFVALGHNKNDVTETFVHNLLRGSGIKGFTGISPKINRIIRPVLFASREQIMEYSQQFDIHYREDSTNKSTKYTRNKIRNLILPRFKEINANFEDHIHQTIAFFDDVNLLLKEHLENYKDKIFEEGKPHLIKISELHKIPYYATVLFYILNDYEFNSSTVEDILNSLNEEPGKIFYSDSHILLKDRDHLIVRPKIINEEFEIQLEDKEKMISKPFPLRFKRFPKKDDFEIPTQKNIAVLDYDKLHFPLKIRRWKQGDRFIPLGMMNFKKLSDFFIDEKLSIFEKEDLYLLTDNNDAIIWIIDHRIDDRFKITRDTKNIYHIEKGI